MAGATAAGEGDEAAEARWQEVLALDVDRAVIIVGALPGAVGLLLTICR